MRGLAGRLAILLAVALAAIQGARASEIACPPNYQASTVRCTDGSARYCAQAPDRHSPGARLICEYAMLGLVYEDIYADQQRMLRAGTLHMDELVAWRKKRNACETVRCVDAVFADWRRLAAKRPGAHAPAPPPLPRNIAAKEGRTAPPKPAIVAPAPAADVPPALPEPPVALARAEEPEPVLLSASPAPVRSTRHIAPRMFAWLVLPVAILCMLAWAVGHGKGQQMAPAAVRVWVDRLHHLPHITFVLGTLVLINGVLLVVVLVT